LADCRSHHEGYDQEEAFEKTLSTQLVRTIDFVKFAETKNAAPSYVLLALDHRHDQPANELGQLATRLQCRICAALPLFAAGGLVCILSFVPQVLAQFFETDDDSVSLLYWGAAPSTHSSAAFDLIPYARRSNP
jgi:hypothetical protein